MSYYGEEVNNVFVSMCDIVIFFCNLNKYCIFNILNKIRVGKKFKISIMIFKILFFLIKSFELLVYV